MKREKVKEIKRALKICYGLCNETCPYYTLGCMKNLSKDALKLINELEREKKRLNKALVNNLKAYKVGYKSGYKDAAGLIDKILNEITV